MKQKLVNNFGILARKRKSPTVIGFALFFSVGTLLSQAAVITWQDYAAGNTVQSSDELLVTATDMVGGVYNGIDGGRGVLYNGDYRIAPQNSLDPALGTTTFSTTGVEALDYLTLDIDLVTHTDKTGFYRLEITSDYNDTKFISDEYASHLYVQNGSDPDYAFSISTIDISSIDPAFANVAAGTTINWTVQQVISRYQENPNLPDGLDTYAFSYVDIANGYRNNALSYDSYGNRLKRLLHSPTSTRITVASAASTVPEPSVISMSAVFGVLTLLRRRR